MLPFDEAMSALQAVLDTQRVVADAMEKSLRAQASLSLAQYEVLHRLDQAPDRRLRMVDITRRLYFSKSGVTQLVDRLEEAGLVTRESCRSDRRLTYARLTTPGIEALRRSGPVCAAVVEEHFARHLSGQDLRCVRDALAKVLRAAGYPGEHPGADAERADPAAAALAKDRQPG
jgi:DNA-binding MarR family transcriptional regulator